MLPALPITIRSFRPDDAEAVASIVNTTMQRSNAADYPADVIDRLVAYNTAAKHRSLVEAGRETLVAAYAAGRLIGTGALDAGELATLFVLPEAQGLGVGRQLVDAIERLARERGLAEVTLRSSVTAVEFYERMGFSRLGPPHDTPSGTQIPMGKPLG